MNHLSIREMRLMLVPDVLTNDFEHMVLETYFDSKWHDVEHITSHVDQFALYAHSEEETGNIFQLVDDPDWIEENSGDVIAMHWLDLQMDVMEVLDYHHIFHCDDDKGEDGIYDYRGEMYNAPIRTVW